MKKVVIIWSSPNTDGLTASAKNMFVSGLADRGIQAEEIHLNAMNIDFSDFILIDIIKHNKVKIITIDSILNIKI